MIENRMAVPTTRWSGNPNDPNAPEETRPDGCTCLYEDGYITTAADQHYADNERCDLYECECGHQKRHHGPQGCEVELGDRYRGKEYMEAGGPCTCELTREDIVLIGRFGSLEVGRKIVAAQKARGGCECPACRGEA